MTGASIFTGVGGPPAAETRGTLVPGRGTNRMTSSWFQVPPLGAPRVRERLDLASCPGRPS